MKLGTETGSLVNHLYSRAVVGQPTPEVGMGATILCWTDRDAATVIATWKDMTGRTYVTVQEDHAQRIDKNGYGGNQDYEYSQNFEGALHTFRQEPDGTWMKMTPGKKPNTWKKNKCEGLRLGDRDHYYDPCF